MRARRAVNAALVFGVLAAAPQARQNAPSVYGGDSPQAVVAALQKAIAGDDFKATLPYISPDSRRALADDAIGGLLIVIAFTNPDDAMPGKKPLPPAELAAKRKGYRAVVDLARQTLEPHGLDGIVGKPALAPETQKAVAAALARTDTVVLMGSLVDAMEKIGPLLGMKNDDDPRIPFRIGAVTDYRVAGDAASAKSEGESLEFVRIDGRWYFAPPAPAPVK